jgi:hypothetical protein
LLTYNSKSLFSLFEKLNIKYKKKASYSELLDVILKEIKSNDKFIKGISFLMVEGSDAVKKNKKVPFIKILNSVTKGIKLIAQYFKDYPEKESLFKRKTLEMLGLKSSITIKTNSMLEFLIKSMLISLNFTLEIITSLKGISSNSLKSEYEIDFIFFVEKEKSLKSEKEAIVADSEKGYKKNYLPHEWENPDAVKAFFSSDAYIKKYGKESFDVVISTEALEHIENWKLANKAGAKSVFKALGY